MRRVWAIAVDAYWHFIGDDGWAIASHIALSVLMAMFPFFIVLTSLGGLFGSADLADRVANLLFASWPPEVAAPLAQEIHQVLTTTHRGALTFGGVLAVYFASSGVESLRIGLNRAYVGVETRNWLPAGRRSIREIIPGIVATLLLWLATAVGFARYLAQFSVSYVNTYAGLASAMIALVFLYWTATIFVYGGELNAAHMRARTKQGMAPEDPAGAGHQRA